MHVSLECIAQEENARADVFRCARKVTIANLAGVFFAVLMTREGVRANAPICLMIQTTVVLVEINVYQVRSVLEAFAAENVYKDGLSVMGSAEISLEIM